MPDYSIQPDQLTSDKMKHSHSAVTAAVFTLAIITELSQGYSGFETCNNEYDVKLEKFPPKAETAKNHPVERLADELNSLTVKVCENEFLEYFLEPLAFLDFSGVNGQKLIGKERNLYESSHRLQITSKYILEQLSKTSDYKGVTVKYRNVTKLRFIQSNRQDVHLNEEWHEIPKNRLDNEDVYVELKLKTSGRDTLRTMQVNALNEAKTTNTIVPANFVKIEFRIQNGFQPEEKSVRSVDIHRFILGELKTIDNKEWEYFSMKNEDHPYWPVPVSIETGWILIQKRTTPGYDFDRDWNTYKHGFGHWETDFWIGLEKIHRITDFNEYGLRVEFWTHTGLQRSAEWKRFKVWGEDSGYAVDTSGFNYNSSVGFYGDWVFEYLQWTKFVTKDRDYTSRSLSVKCSDQVGGGWWMQPVDNGGCDSIHFNNKLRDRFGCEDGYVTYGRYNDQRCGPENLKATHMFLFKSV